MKLSYNETKELIEIVLNSPRETAREHLHHSLERKKQQTGAFYDAIAEHAPGMRLTSEQWFELLSRLPNRLLHSQLPINKILSEGKIRKLPPTTG